MDKTGGSMDEWWVAVLSMMETFHNDGRYHMYGSKNGQQQRDRQVHERAEGGRPVDDGDIHIYGRDIDHNGNETGGSVKGWKVAIWLMMETSTSTPSHLVIRGFDYEVAQRHRDR
jgi:hypothetical protein